MAALEGELVYSLECLKPAKAMLPSRLRDARISEWPAFGEKSEHCDHCHNVCRRLFPVRRTRQAP